MVIKINLLHVESLCAATERLLSKDHTLIAKEKEEIRGCVDKLRERQDEISFLKLSHLNNMYKISKFELFITFAIFGSTSVDIDIINEIRKYTDTLTCDDRRSPILSRQPVKFRVSL